MDRTAAEFAASSGPPEASRRPLTPRRVLEELLWLPVTLLAFLAVVLFLLPLARLVLCLPLAMLGQWPPEGRRRR